MRRDGILRCQRLMSLCVENVREMQSPEISSNLAEFRTLRFGQLRNGGERVAIDFVASDRWLATGDFFASLRVF